MERSSDLPWKSADKKYMAVWRCETSGKILIKSLYLVPLFRAHGYFLSILNAISSSTKVTTTFVLTSDVSCQIKPKPFSV